MRTHFDGISVLNSVFAVLMIGLVVIGAVYQLILLPIYVVWLFLRSVLGH